MVSQNLNTPPSFFAVLFIGPTASGKTQCAHDFSHWLHSHHNIACAVVNLDAFQIYKEFSVGTAKPSAQEMQTYRYRAIDFLEPTQNLDPQECAQMLWKECRLLTAQKILPLCVGGSGLYLRAFLHGLDPLPPRDPAFRAFLHTLASEKGWPWCHEWLKKVDPQRAEELHPHDKTRIERALEIYHVLGKPMSAIRSKTTRIGQQTSVFDNCVVQFCLEAPVLKKRIETRVHDLFEKGWLEEVLQLQHKYGARLESLHAMKALGYSQVLKYIKNNPALFSAERLPFAKTAPSFENLKTSIATLTWHYAKKQRTWISKEKKDFIIQYVNKNSFHTLFENLAKKIKIPLFD